ncbi:DUF2157 domain-containing protein [Phormidesmis sp. 146-35]
MPSENFRRQLRQEVQTWQTDGLINPTQLQQLSDRYQLDRLDLQDKNRFTRILIGLGCILIGLGVITFVAANWQDIPRGARVAMLLSLFASINFAGFWLWKGSRDQWQSRLGEGFLLLGSLVLGANMALMAQMFHIGGSPHELFLTWGIGVLLMAYSLRLTSLGGLAIMLIGIGYWWGWWQVSRTDEFSILNLIIHQMPLVAGLMYLPLAYWCRPLAGNSKRSRVLFLFTAIAVGSSLSNAISTNALQSGLGLAMVAILPAALLWGYDDSLWNDLLRRPSSRISRPFQKLARGVAVLLLGSLLYWLSFKGAWSLTHSTSPNFELPEWRSLPSILILTVLMVVEWVYLVRSGRTRSGRLRVNLNTVIVGSFLVILGLLIYWDTEISQIQILATFVSNVLLAMLGIGTIRESLGTGDRRLFWFGIVLLALQIYSRLLEYQTGLLLKSLVFVLCGVGIIAAGLWFERYVRTIAPSPQILPEESL